MEWNEKRTEEVLQQYVAAQRRQTVEVKLKGAGAGKNLLWGFRPAVVARYSVAVAASLVLGVFLLLNEPQKVYGYINEVPVTDKAQAVELSQQMFEDLALGMAPAEDALDNLLKL